MEKDTITALSTYPLQSAIAIIRISGAKTFEITSQIFVSKNNKPIHNLSSLKRILGFIKHNEQIIDEVILSVYKSPSSYTGEDMIEISCHGNPIIINNILNLLVKKGIRIAEPGEFTKRAFLNGKIDLSQAEAVCDIITAKNELALKIALNQLIGKEYKVFEKLHSDILNILTHIEAEIDFANEDIQKLTMEQILKEIEEIEEQIDYLIKNSESGLLLKEGIKIAITGAVNTGKSSLLNLLLNKKKAIVTHIPGTTRDIIEDNYNIDGFPVKIFDTAGIRKTDDIVEIEGIKRTFETIESADIVLFLLDGSRKINKDDIDLFNKIKDKQYILIINKIDLPVIIDKDTIKTEFNISEIQDILKISCLKNSGINDLTKTIKNIIINKNIFAIDDIIIANIRHKEALIKAKTLLQEMKEATKTKAYELIAIDLKRVVDEIGSIIGKITSEDILENIFKNFCIGK